MIKTKKLGVIVAVDGQISNVGMYEMTNDADLIWFGDILTGPKIGAFLTINQNDIKIIASVITEKVLDQQNTIKSTEFDNRYSKNSINRVIQIKTRGVIINKQFEVTSSFVPMIGNEITLTTQEELKIIYSIKHDEPVIHIGYSILENQPVQLSINNFFASHIGIFGNTGSGKSNTLHKLYLELFKSDFKDKIFEKSQFFIVDFNGEYTGKDLFNGNFNKKKVFNINTRGDKTDKIFVTKKYFFDADILSILFDARPATQVPFLRNAIETFNNISNQGEFNFGTFVTGIVKKILTTGNSTIQNSLQEWTNTAKKFVNNPQIFNNIDQITRYENGHYKIIGSTQFTGSDAFISTGTVAAVSSQKWKYLNLISNENSNHDIPSAINEQWNKSSEINKLNMFLYFQRIHSIAWGKINPEHINPLFSRIESSLKSLEEIIEIKDNISSDYRAINIFNLVHANQEITRLVPMLISKMFYDGQKAMVSGKSVTQTKHLIIDEAHNILNAEHKSIGDDWQDYRMAVFEEIIKEGRKFGFYLTLSSQRPADISPTVMSQIHNYIIHRLVNEKDLRMLENTMPTLDKSSYQIIPSLGKGEAIITGNAMQVPVFVRIPKEGKNSRPNSDDVKLTDIWN
ncbi:ATP-binding protein [Leuconostoc mesenteroides]|uniref:ATP-binding protein n=1 Tax=Leuconostoc mesenteroides TaxID=1245 RepID=UPI003889A0F2